MVARLTAAVPRFVLLPLLALLGTATLTFAADTRIAGSPPPASSAPPERATLVVPDVRRQAYVFAKGTLEDAGFSWRVAGSVRGYAVNLVAAQNPGPGTRVLDTGSPTIALTLVRNPKYPERGTPENTSPFRGTEIAIAGVPTRPTSGSAPKPKAKEKPAAKPRAKPKPAKPKAAGRAPAPRQERPPAFAVSGAPNEPLDEIPLTARAENLDSWLRLHPKPTSANVRYWLYQHQWIVTGARFGWWRGEQALVRLIAIDRRVQKAWGVGGRSERIARAALAYVRANSR